MAPYFIRNLIPKRESYANHRPFFQVLFSLTWLQWAHLWSGWLAWTCDSLDFFSVSLSVDNLGTQFNESTHNIVRCNLSALNPN